MKNLLHDLMERKLITPPEWLPDNLVLLNISGSTAYGISTNKSDIDVVGIAVPSKDLIYGYDPIFDEYQQHHVKDGTLEYDFKIYSIGKFFRLAEQGNPNILDFALTPEKHCLFSTNVGRKIRDFAQNFCSKQSIDRYFGFAHNHFMQMSRKSKNIAEISEKRRNLFEKFGYDTKDAAHCVRAIYCLKEMLEKGTYNIECHPDHIKSIREGIFTFDEVQKYVEHLRTLVKEVAELSTLRDKPDHKKCRDFLISCLEEFHGK